MSREFGGGSFAKEAIEPENQTPESDYAFHQEVIDELREPMSRMLEAIREKLDAHAYDMIIGDDATGRIPTLAIRRFMEKLYGDSEHVQTLFFAGGTPDDFRDADAKIEKMKVSLQKVLDAHSQKRALVVTEAIMSGSGLKPIVRSLHALGKEYDILAVGHDMTEKVSEEALEFRLGARPVFGMEGTPSLYQDKFRHEMAGVNKRKIDVHSTTQLQYKGDQVPQTDEQKRQYLIDTRESVRALGDQLFEQFQRIEPKNKEVNI